MSAFKHAIAACGFSQKEAASFLDVSESKIKKWSSERASVPVGVWSDLSGLYARMEDAVDIMIDLVDANEPDKVEVSYSGKHGQWPCLGTADAVEAMFRLRLSL